MILQNFIPAECWGKNYICGFQIFIFDNEKPQYCWHQSLKEVIVEMTKKRLGVTAVVDKKKIY